MMRIWTIAAMAALITGAAQAEGFAVGNFLDLEVDTEAFETGEFETLPERRRLMVACLECSRTAVVTLRLQSGQEDTEANLRDGTLTAEFLNEGCSNAEGGVTCIDVELVSVGEAVGWVTRTQSGSDRYLQTYELYLGGEKLNVQAIAESRDEADEIGRTAFETIVPAIVIGDEG